MKDGFRILSGKNCVWFGALIAILFFSGIANGEIISIRSENEALVGPFLVDSTQAFGCAGMNMLVTVKGQFLDLTNEIKVSPSSGVKAKIVSRQGGFDTFIKLKIEVSSSAADAAVDTTRIITLVRPALLGIGTDQDSIQLALERTATVDSVEPNRALKGSVTRVVLEGNNVNALSLNPSFSPGPGAAGFTDGRIISSTSSRVEMDLKFNSDGAFPACGHYNERLKRCLKLSGIRCERPPHVVVAGVAPSLTISNESITEGTDLVFNLTLSAPNPQGATVNFETSPGTASAGIACGVGDYIPSFGRVVFSSTETTKTIAVKTCSDTIFERSELFTVTLSNPIGLIIADSSGTGTINNKFIVPSPTDPIGPITPPPSGVPKPPAPGTPPPEPPVIPPAPPAPPDLAVSIQGDPAIQRLGEGRKNVTVTVLIQNIGRGASAPCSNEVLLNDNVKDTFTLDSIPANGRVTKSVSFETQQNGANTVKVKVDTDDRNAEVLENNNRAAVDIAL